MKKNTLIFVVLAILLAVPVSAKDNKALKKGYHGNLELGTSAMTMKMMGNSSVEPDEMIRLSSTHGYAFGNGVFIGAGAGCNFQLIEDLHYASVFMDVKYNFVDASASPFIEGRTGYNYCINKYNDIGGVFVSTAAGVDFGRMSARIGYELAPIKENVRASNGAHGYALYTSNQFYFSLAFNF